MGELKRRPGDARGEQQLTQAERRSGIAGRAGQRRCPRAAEAQPREEHGEDDGEGEHGAADLECEQPRPHHLGRQCREPREADRHEQAAVDRPPRSLGRCGGRRSGRQAGDDRSQRRHREVASHRDAPRREQIDAGQQAVGRHQAAADRAHQIAGVEQAQPAVGGRSPRDESGQHRHGGTHEHRRRQQADCRDEPTQHNARVSSRQARGIERSEGRRRPEEPRPTHRDAGLEGGVDRERVPSGSGQPRGDEAAKAQPPHERPQQHGQGDRG